MGLKLYILPLKNSYLPDTELIKILNTDSIVLIVIVILLLNLVQIGSYKLKAVNIPFPKQIFKKTNFVDHSRC